MKQPTARSAAVALAAAAAVFVLLQVLPFGPDRDAAPAEVVVTWPDERTHELAARACLDCHGGDTRWPWYASVAPFSWLIAQHVAEGRALFDVSRPDPGEEAYEAGETLREGEMPPWYYVFLHPEARLTLEEKRALAAGLDRMFGGEGGEGAEVARGGDAEDDEEDDDE